MEYHLISHMYLFMQGRQYKTIFSQFQANILLASKIVNELQGFTPLLPSRELPSQRHLKETTQIPSDNYQRSLLMTKVVLGE